MGGIVRRCEIAPRGLEDQVYRLTAKEIEKITGIKGHHPIRQRNILLKAGIHCFVNEMQEVVVFESWVDAAALPQEILGRLISELKGEDEEESQRAFDEEFERNLKKAFGTKS